MKRTYVVALLGAGTIALGAAAFAASGTMPGTAPQVGTLDVATASIRQRHTMEDMLALSNGISYDAAARLLGVPGHVEARQVLDTLDLVDHTGVAVYRWPNPDGSRILLVFRDDRLIHRTQVGLR